MKMNWIQWFVSRRERWGLTLRGGLVLLALGLVMAMMAVTSVCGFLSPTHRCKAQVLVVEGWMPDYAIEGAAKEFIHGGYSYLMTAGSPFESGYYFTNHKTSADLAADTLAHWGIAQDRIIRAPSGRVKQGRTREHAKAVMQWLRKHDPSVTAVNVYSLSVHARRTWRTFESVAGPGVAVGIIAHEDESFDAAAWWKSSEGVKSVMTEFLGWVYMNFQSLKGNG